MANGNGTKWGTGFNAWLKTNWLLLGLIVAATAWAVRLDNRMFLLENQVQDMRHTLRKVLQEKIDHPSFKEHMIE